MENPKGRRGAEGWGLNLLGDFVVGCVKNNENNGRAEGRGPRAENRGPRERAAATYTKTAKKIFKKNEARCRRRWEIPLTLKTPNNPL